MPKVNFNPWHEYNNTQSVELLLYIVFIYPQTMYKMNKTTMGKKEVQLEGSYNAKTVYLHRSMSMHPETRNLFMASYF